MRLFLPFLAFTACSLGLSAKAPEMGIKERLEASTAFSEVVADTIHEIRPGVTETSLHVLKADGNPVQLYIVEADLSNGEVSFEVATPGDSAVADGAVRATLSQMAMDADCPGHRVLAMVNADFWDVKTMDVRGPLHRRGEAIKSNYVYTPRLWQQALSFIGVMDNGNIAIADTIAYHGAKTRLREATGSGIMVLKDGAIPALPEKFIDPRTFIGFNSKGKVYIVTADGRMDGYSVGLTYPEMGALMQALGCISAANLDGGGSAQMLVRQPDSSFKIVNHPSDHRERPVINAWMLVSTTEN